MKINNIFNKVSNLIDTKKQENLIYNELLNNSLRFENLKDLNNTNKLINEGNIEELLLLCPNLNKETAQIIDNLIPVYETYIKVIYITQRIDNTNYFLIFTNHRLWLLTKTKYTIYNYQDISIFDIISKSVMTQVINFNNIILGVDTSYNNILEIHKLIKDPNYRNNLIFEKTKYLCGLTPTYQNLNKILSGISIDNNNNIVFHDKKLKNYKYNYNEILNYELLEDNIVVLKRKSNNYSHSLTSVKQTCSTMNIRITLTDNRIFLIPILEPTAFNSQYKHTDSIYINNYNFAKTIIEKLDSLNPKLY